MVKARAKLRNIVSHQQRIGSQGAENEEKSLVKKLSQRSERAGSKVVAVGETSSKSSDVGQEEPQDLVTTDKWGGGKGKGVLETSRAPSLRHWEDGGSRCPGKGRW